LQLVTVIVTRIRPQLQIEILLLLVKEDTKKILITTEILNFNVNLKKDQPLLHIKLVKVIKMLKLVVKYIVICCN